MLDIPMNDAWTLMIDHHKVQWIQYELPYDHGPIRCLHGSCKVNDEVLIHSGCTQKFYSNRLECDNHAETLLNFQFGVKSLLKTVIDFVLENNIEYCDEIPQILQDIIRNRNEPRIFHGLPVKCGQRIFSRSVILSGL